MIEKIRQDQLTARKARDSFKSKLLTTLLGELTMPGKEADPIKVITKFIKNAKEIININNSIEAKKEIDILEKYLPVQMSDISLNMTIIGILTSLQEPKLGDVMKILKANYGGTYDNRQAVAFIKTELKLN